jgi:hypothetical protein
LLKTAVALGFRVHSGWAALVALAGPGDAPRVIVRRRVVLADAAIRGAKQPYHTAESIGLPAAVAFLGKCQDATNALALQAIQDCLNELHRYDLAGACVLLASGRPLPDVPSILASHALIHTAEGEFYRAALRQACRARGIRETGMRERDLLPEIGPSGVGAWGKAIGPPWRQDEKLAALAAWRILEGGY